MLKRIPLVLVLAFTLACSESALEPTDQPADDVPAAVPSFDSENAALVINWGQDEASCAAVCGTQQGPVLCVANGKATSVINSAGNQTFTCTDADWLLAPPVDALRLPVNCGWGGGQAVITPSGKVNFYCNNN